jgi:hypothetical protein
MSEGQQQQREGSSPSTHEYTDTTALVLQSSPAESRILGHIRLPRRGIFEVTNEQKIILISSDDLAYIATLVGVTPLNGVGGAESLLGRTLISYDEGELYIPETIRKRECVTPRMCNALCWFAVFLFIWTLVLVLPFWAFNVNCPPCRH